MVVKVGLRQPLGAALMLQDLAYLALRVWVQNKSSLDIDKLFKSLWSVLRHGAQVLFTPPHAHQQDTNSCSNKGQCSEVVSASAVAWPS